MKRAFTLIELLVVVLIIGILSAMALAQYQRAVNRSRGTEAVTTIAAIRGALERYYLANGTYQGSETGLDITLPTLKYFKYCPGSDGRNGSPQANACSPAQVVNSFPGCSQVGSTSCRVGLVNDDAVELIMVVRCDQAESDTNYGNGIYCIDTQSSTKKCEDFFQCSNSVGSTYGGEFHSYGCRL